MIVKEVNNFTNEGSPDTRTVGIELDGMTLVNTTVYGSKAISVTIHDLNRTDLLKLITELTYILNDISI